jgi:DUF2971 family protein
MSRKKFETKELLLCKIRKPMTTEPKENWRVTLMDRLAEPPKLDPLAVKLATLAGGVPKTVFHYTDAKGLQGIVEDKGIWATAASYLNDSSEIEYGCDILGEVFDNWEKANSDPASLSATIVRSLKGIFNNPLSKTERAITIYIACFCKDENLLSQWRAYGQAGGYSIGFSLAGKGLQAVGGKLHGLKPENDLYRATLTRVIYDKETQYTSLEGGLKRYLSALEHPEMYALLGSLEKEEKREFIGTAMILIELFLMQQIVAFKNKAFKDEHEWRIVVQPLLKGMQSAATKDEALYLRSARGLIIPYVKLIPTEIRLPIASITIGPTLDKIRAERSVRLLLHQNGHEDFKIEGSDIPVVM